MGSSSSTSSTNISEETNINTVDNRVGGDDANLAGNITINASDSDAGNISITTTDLGALDAASEIADRSLQLSSDAFGAALSSNQQAVDDAIDVAKEASTDEGARTTQLLIIGGVLIFIAGAFILIRGKK